MVYPAGVFHYFCELLFGQRVIECLRLCLLLLLSPVLLVHEDLVPEIHDYCVVFLLVMLSIMLLVMLSVMLLVMLRKSCMLS